MRFTVKKDNTSPLLGAQLQDPNANAVDLTGASVVFNMADFDGNVIVNGGSASITSEDQGRVQYAWQLSDTSSAGSFRGEFKVTYSGGQIETFPNNGYIIIDIVSDLT